MQRFFAVLVTFGLAVICSAAKRPPNIVMIISDDQAWTDYGFMGHAQIRTPHIDRLAAQSLTFVNGYVTSSLCCPSLASIVTGLYPHQHKVTSNDPPMPAGAARTSKEFLDGREVMNRHMEAVPTLPRLLSQKGYVSFQSGKWWQGDFSHGGFTHGMTRGERHGDDGLDIGRKTMKPIYDFIEATRAENKPFFVWYAPMLPHEPHNPPDRFLQKYKDKTPSLSVAKYWATVEWFDETVGELLGYLDKNGLTENTIVIFLADNGWIQNPSGPGYAPKSKQSPYDGGLRTPIMIRWRERVKPRKSESLAMSIDLMPTLLTAAGLKLTREMQGLNLLDEKAVRSRKAIYGECFTHTAVDLDRPSANLRWRWVREGDWKLMVPASQNEPNAKPELYNVAKDPIEEKNLTSSETGKVKHLTGLLDKWWNGK
jgi:uncharacterized sulfatase